MTTDRDLLVKIVEQRGLLRLAEPVQLASGEWSREFVDGKQALGDGDDLALACRLILRTLEEAGIEFDAVGGLTMGADQFAHGTAILGHKRWFVVRKAPKGRGTNKRIEGSALTARSRVVLVDDVVTTGGSIRDALDAVTAEAGCHVVAAVACVDRGESTRRYFDQQMIPYFSLVSYRDLGIPPVGSARLGA